MREWKVNFFNSSVTAPVGSFKSRTSENKCMATWTPAHTKDPNAICSARFPTPHASLAANRGKTEVCLQQTAHKSVIIRLATNTSNLN